MRDDLIDQIRALQDELKDLGVHKEHFELRRMKDANLSELLESLREQLETRKRFLGVG